MERTPPWALQRVSNGRHGSLVAPIEKPAFGLSLILLVAFAIEMATGGPGRWGLSARSLAEGRFETIFTHMFSHGSPAHFALNASALGVFASPFIARVGWRRPGLQRFSLLFLLSGLCGAAMYLALNRNGGVPMVGASGAVCGLWGVSMRLPAERSAPLLSVRDPIVSRELGQFVLSNAVLFGFLFLVDHGRGGGLAWEAHTGGMLFGLFAAPLFVDDRQAVS